MLNNQRLMNGTATYEEYVTAVKKDSAWIWYVPDQPDELCLIVLNDSGINIRNIRNQKESLCLLAVDKDPGALSCIKKENRTYPVCLKAVSKCGSMLRCVDDTMKTDEMCVAALSNNGLALQWITNKIERYCMIAIKNNYMALRLIEKPSEQMCWVALEKTPFAIRQIDKPSEMMCLNAVTRNSDVLQFLDQEYQTFEVCLIAVKQNIMLIGAVKDPEMKKRVIQRLTCQVVLDCDQFS